MRQSYDSELIGVRDGSSQTEFDIKSFDNEEGMQKLFQYYLHQDYWNYYQSLRPPVMPKRFYLRRLAKLTDFMSYSQYMTSVPFLISKKALKIFEDFNIQKSYLYPIEIFKRVEKLDEEYFIFECPPLDFDTVNYAKSVFYTAVTPMRERTYHSIKSMEHFLEFKEKNRLFGVERICLNENAPQSLDYYTTRIGGLFISESLKSAIEAANLTGLKVFEGILKVELIFSD